MKIAYLVTLFPCWSETFILREILELTRLGRKVRIFSLKPASEKMVHSAAIKFQSATRYPRLLAVLRSSLYQILQHPLKVSRILLELIANGYRHPLMLAKTLAMFPVVLAFAGAMKTGGITHIHAHWATYPSTAAWIIKRLTGIPYSFTAHAHDIWLEKPYLREKIEAAKTVATISQYNVNYLAELYGASIRRKFAVIHCGLEPTEFEPIEQNGEPVSKVVSVGRFGEIKGFEYLIRACRELRDRGQQVHCTLIGSGPLQRNMQTLSQDLGLGDQVTFAGALPQADLKQVLRHSDLFVLPSVQTQAGDQDGIPVALMEAMLMGLPVISTTVSGIPELIHDHQTGLIVPPRDPLALADAMGEMFSDGQLRGHCATAARRYVASDFNIRRLVRQLLQIFEPQPVR